MDDAYDVRAVEARLARMEAARRARAVATKAAAPSASYSKPEAMAMAPSAHHATVVGDFELSAVDSSDSDDDDAHDNDASTSTSSALEQDSLVPSAARLCGKKKATTLRDSLDLSMSVSVAVPTDEPTVPARHNAAGASKATTHDLRGAATEQAPASRADVASHPARFDPRVVAPIARAAMTTTADPIGVDVFAGKLVQRRRELERMGEQQPQQHAIPRREELARAESEWTRPLYAAVGPPAVPTKGELKPPAVGVARAHTRHDAVTATHDLGCSRGTKVPEAKTVRPSTDTLEASGRASGREVHDTRPKAPIRRAVVTTPEPDVDSPPKPTDASATRRGFEAAFLVPVTTTNAAAAVPPPHMRQPLKPPPPVRLPVASEALAPQAAPIPKKPSVPTPISPSLAATVSSPSSTTTPAPTTKPPGYARTTAASNQTPAPPAPTAKKIASPTKREPEDCATDDDVIDDLLTAEELRLRESLDKLTTRLSSLVTARTPSVSQTTKHSSNEPAPRNSAEHDDNKAIRSASYGGGTHSRLYQPTSPTSRASHAKRSELSGGVHKARVRIGGVTAQEAAASRADTTADGKHKIIVKRDLAHLLF